MTIKKVHLKSIVLDRKMFNHPHKDCVIYDNLIDFYVFEANLG